jgi:hypothetical protein
VEFYLMIADHLLPYWVEPKYRKILRFFMRL